MENGNEQRASLQQPALGGRSDSFAQVFSNGKYNAGPTGPDCITNMLLLIYRGFLHIVTCEWRQIHKAWLLLS